MISGGFQSADFSRQFCFSPIFRLVHLTNVAYQEDAQTKVQRWQTKTRPSEQPEPPDSWLMDGETQPQS